MTMNLLDQILEHNEYFVENNLYEQYRTSRFPNKKLVVVSCMDTRLTELLPAAMGLKNGDSKIIKTAGAVVSHPFGSVMRSIMVAIYELGAQEICVVGHHDCGMTSIDPNHTLQKMRDRGISENTIDTLGYAGIDLRHWLKGISSLEESVLESARVIRQHPLIPADVRVHGLVIHPVTGRLEVLAGDYQLETDLA